MRLEKNYCWPSWFYAALPVANKKKISHSWLKNLDRGQNYLWKALNIYDDFLDGAGQAALLPLANSAFRNFLEIYYRSGLSINFYKKFNYLLDNLDKANRLEARSLRLKIDQNLIKTSGPLPIFSNLTSLADKSLILAAGPLAILDRLGYKENSLFIKTTDKFFRCALAAKQLADDARDWLDDLSQRKITAVNILVIRAAQKHQLALDLNNNLAAILRLFSRDASLRTSQNIIQLCQAARRAGKSINLPKNNRLLTELLEPLEKATAESLEFRKLLFKNG